MISLDTGFSPDEMSAPFEKGCPVKNMAGRG